MAGKGYSIDGAGVARNPDGSLYNGNGIPPDGGAYTHIPTEEGGLVVVDTATGEIVYLQEPNGRTQSFAPGEGPPSPFDAGYVAAVRADNDAAGYVVGADVPVNGRTGERLREMDAYGITPEDPIDYNQIYGKSPDQLAYEKWALDQGVAMANRSDARYNIGNTGMTQSAALARQVELGAAPQSAGVNLGNAPQVNLTNLGTAPQTGRVQLGAVDQMGRVQLGNASQVGRVDMGQASTTGRVDMGPAQQANLYTTNINGAFDSSLGAYGQAGAYNDYATNIDGSYIQDAAEMQRLAAMGLAPSAAENMYLQGGIDTQLALDRSRDNTQWQAQRSIEDMVREQLSQAARARGSSGFGLATMNAQNQSALGQARISADALQQMGQNDLQYIAAGQTAYNQAALTRANEMATARDAYGNLGQAIRAGDFQGAANALALAQGYQGIDAAYLQAAQQNSEWANANSQFNATNLNAFAQAQAQLDQSRNQFNSTSLNDWRAQQAQLDAQRNQYNATNSQEVMLQQAALDQARNQTNMAASNDWRVQQGQLDQSRNQFNANNALNLQLSQGELDQQARMYNATNMQNQTFQQGQLSQQNNQYNANLTQQQAFQQGQLTQGTNQFNATQTNQIGQANYDRNLALQQGNQQAMIQAGAADDQFLGNTLALGQNQQNAAMDARMRGAEQQQAFIAQNADRTSNYLTNNATNAIARRQAENQEQAAWIGAGGTAVAALLPALATASTASDRRVKNIEGKAPPADFTRATDHVYQYKGGYGQEPGTHVGPMADALPEDVIRVKDGIKHVDVARLALREVGALGNLQKRVAQLEARK